MIAPTKQPSLRTPTSGVIIEMLYLCAVGLSASIAAIAIGRPPAQRQKSARPSRPSSQKAQ